MGLRLKRSKCSSLGFSEEEKAAFADDAAWDAPAKKSLPVDSSPVYQPDLAPSQAKPLGSSCVDFEVKVRGGKEAALFEEQRKARFALDARSRKVLYLALALVVVFVLALVLPNNIFNVNNSELSPAWFASVVGRNVQNLVTVLCGAGAFGSIDLVVIKLVIVGLAGAALAVAGTAYQGALKNQLACPSTLGVMSGAQLGCILYIWIVPMGFIGFAASGDSSLSSIESGISSSLNTVEQMLALSQMAVFSLAGSCIVVATVMWVSGIVAHGHNPRVAMVIVGQVVAGLISGFVVIARMYFTSYGTDYQIQAMTTIMLGGFDNAFTVSYLIMVAVPVLACLAVILFARNKLNLLAFGEEEARSMGVKTTALRVGMVACCTLITAVVVAYCGAIGYVGFLIPHLARRIVGPDFRFLLPASALMGASFLLLAFYCVSNFSIPGGSISMATTGIGVIVFIVVIFQQRRSGNASW